MVHFNLKFDICVVINVQKLIVFGQRYVSAGFFFDILYSLFFGCAPFLFYLMFSCELKQKLMVELAAIVICLNSANHKAL